MIRSFFSNNSVSLKGRSYVPMAHTERLRAYWPLANTARLSGYRLGRARPPQPIRPLTRAYVLDGLRDVHPNVSKPSARIRPALHDFIQRRYVTPTILQVSRLQVSHKTPYIGIPLCIQMAQYIFLSNASCPVCNFEQRCQYHISCDCQSNRSVQVPYP